MHVSALKVVFYSGSDELASIKVKTKGLAEVDLFNFLDNWAVYFSERLSDCTSYAFMRCDND